MKVPSVDALSHLNYNKISSLIAGIKNAQLTRDKDSDFTWELESCISCAVAPGGNSTLKKTTVIGGGGGEACAELRCNMQPQIHDENRFSTIYGKPRSHLWKCSMAQQYSQWELFHTTVPIRI